MAPPLLPPLLALRVLLALCGSSCERVPQTPSHDGIDSTVHIASGDWLLVGTYTVPFPRPPERVAAVLLLNRANGDRHAYDSTAASLARIGIASLRLDLRGHGESTNRGRFVPFAPGMDTLLEGTPDDVVAGLRWLARRPGIDPDRLGLVGASYSGEYAVRAAQSGTGATVFAMLSPGSLSTESIGWLDALGRRWLFVASRNERTQATRDVIADVLTNSSRADVWLWEPEAHATQLLAVVPELPMLLAAWLAAQLSGS